MFQVFKDYYNAYGTLGNFLTHKITHFVVGFFVCLVCSVVQHGVFGLVLVGMLAVGKEVVDEYQYPMPILFHLFDVIITVLGAVVAFGLFKVL